jgi:hypothetical protein
MAKVCAQLRFRATARRSNKREDVHVILRHALHHFRLLFRTRLVECLAMVRYEHLVRSKGRGEGLCYLIPDYNYQFNVWVPLETGILHVLLILAMWRTQSGGRGVW